MKQTLGIVRYNFFGFFRNPKVIFILFLEFVLSFLLTGRIMVVMDNYNTPVQAIEPFLWTFGDRTAVLLSSMLLLLLFSDLPKMTPVTPYQLIRTTKKKWLLGQFVYITFVTILYTCFMLLFTSVLCMKDSYPGICGVTQQHCLDSIDSNKNSTEYSSSVSSSSFTAMDNPGNNISPVSCLPCKVAAILPGEDNQIYIPLSQARILCSESGTALTVTKVLLKIKGKTNLENAKQHFE